MGFNDVDISCINVSCISFCSSVHLINLSTDFFYGRRLQWIFVTTCGSLRSSTVINTPTSVCIQNFPPKVYNAKAEKS